LIEYEGIIYFECPDVLLSQCMGRVLRLRDLDQQSGDVHGLDGQVPEKILE